MAAALVLGDADLVRPLVLARIPCAVFAPPEDPVQWSRHVIDRLPWVDHWKRPADAVEVLLRWAQDRGEPPVLMPQTDGDLLMVSRHRERLAQRCRFLLAEVEVVETLVDKARFAAAAERLGLGVPRTRHAVPGRDDARDVDLRFPVVVKPVQRRQDTWTPVESSAKASHVASRQALAAMWPALAAAGMEVVVQEAVPGPETAIESHHAYVDASGGVVAEFTGRKIRTRPPRYGHSTAVEITAAEDVAATGREVLERLGVRGVAKTDFKRAPDGSLHLLEVNPRFTLWHHPAALAGVNFPALVHADLTGAPRPATGPVRPGVRWCLPLSDARAARSAGVGMGRWLRWAAACDARSGTSLDDPGPLLASVLFPFRRRLRRRA